MFDYSEHPLDPCFERVRRAGEHLEDLKTRLEHSRYMQAHTLGIELDPDAPDKIKTTRLPPETYFGMRLLVLLGEVCYNLRSALDYLVYELAILDSGVEQDGTQFPLEDLKERFTGNAPRMLKGLNPAHVAAIERLQPFNGCAWAQQLRDISNPDKHRHLVIVNGLSGFTVHNSLAGDISGIVGYERRAYHPRAGEHPVKVKVHIASHPTFDDGAPVIETLEELKTEVANVLSHFKPEF